MNFPIDISDVVISSGKKIIRLQDHLPAEHYGIIETDPVVAFLHTVRTEERKEVYIFPLTPNSTGGGFIEGVPSDQKIIGTTQAQPGGLMYSLYISGPIIDVRITLGYSYPGQTQIDWEERAIIICDTITEESRPIIELIEAGRPAAEIEAAYRAREEKIQDARFTPRFVRQLREKEAREALSGPNGQTDEKDKKN